MAQEKKWFDKVFVQPLSKLANFRVIKSISAGLQSGVSVLMVGAMLSVISIILGFIPGVSESTFVAKFDVMKDLVFGIAGILFAYGIAAADAKLNKTDQQAAGFLAIVVFFIFMKPTFSVDENYNTVFSTLFTKFGMQSVFVAIVAGIWTGEVSAFFKKRGWIVNSEGLPDIAKVWFEYLLAGTFIILSAWAFTDLLNVDLHTIFNNLLTPLMGIFGNFWGWTLVMSIAPLVFYFGIHPMSVLPIVTPIYYLSLATNVELLASGLEPTVANGFFVANVATWLLLNIGGTGSTLGLNILMLFSKNKAVKKLGQLAIVPSLLNINEPVIFGLPILFNPVLFVPFVLGTLINSSVTFLVMNWGWVNIPATYALASYVPAPINAYILTEDIRAVLLILVLIVIDMVIWAPFLKMHEKSLAAKEAAAGKAA